MCISINGSEIVEVFQSEVAFTSATDKKPIVATYGCDSCIAAGGYDPTHKIAFIAHFGSVDEIREGNVIFQTIRKLTQEIFDNPIQLHLRGGVNGEPGSEEMIRELRAWTTHRDIPMNIVSENLFNGTRLDRTSLSIDSRTGDTSTYSPLSNPHTRKRTAADDLFAITRSISPSIRLLYIPASLHTCAK